MTVRWKFIVTLSVMILSFCSCNKDTEELLSVDQIAAEQNEAHAASHRSCDLTKKMDDLMSDPEYRKTHEEKFSKLNKALNEIQSRSSCATPTIVPMAIHFQGISNPNNSCLLALAQSQVDILNKDFTGTNTDISNWTNQASSFFNGVSNGEACLQFCLADQGHPSGYGVSNGSPAVTINKTNGDFSADWSGYINIYVRANTGALGYSPLGGSGNGDGVVVDATAFGTGAGCGSVSPGAPFNLGRTLTHELGHYLFLDHIWGNGCNVDDLVADTPDQQQEYYECPNQGASSCGSTDMHMSYMDYTNDACMYMFSAGQVNRMEAYIASSLSNVTGNASNVCSTSGSGNTGGGGTGGGNTAACTTPGAGTVTNLSPTSVQITWTAVPDAIKYRIRHRQTGTSAWTTVNTTPPSRTLQNLIADTDYQFQLRTQCPTGWTAWSATTTFTTEPAQGAACIKPGMASVENLNPNKVKVSWTAIPQAIKYRIRFRENGTSNWTVYSPNNPTRTLSNLKAATTYQFQLRTQCPAGWTAWNGLDNFTTDGDNSSSNQVTIKLVLDDYGSETTWELVDNNYNIIQSDGPFQDGQAGTQKTKSFELEEGCFTLYIDDSYGDGICCAYGDGYLELLIDGVVVAESDGQFGYYDYIDFCISENGFREEGRKKDEKKQSLQAKHPPSVVNN